MTFWQLCGNTVLFLRKGRLAGRDVAELLGRLQDDVAQLVTMFVYGSGATVRQVLNFVRDSELMRLDERFTGYLAVAEANAEDNEQSAEAGSVNAFLACAANELWGTEPISKINHPSPHNKELRVQNSIGFS